VLTLTAGTRYFSTYTSEVGSLVGSFGCSKLSTNLFPSPGPAPNPCINHSDFTNLNASALHRTYAGFRGRANLSWKVTEDALLYYTWSQGFRSGGFNRAFTPPGYSPLYPGSASWQIEAKQNGGWSPPRGFAPDSLTNNELGWKTSWFEQRLQWNGAIYQENWNHAQIGALDAALLGGTTITDRLGLDLAGNFVAYDLPPFTTYDGALGMGKDAWLVQLYGENLTDTRAELYANFSLNYKATTVNRPRTVGLHARYNFRGE
jgi:outer membrane receptor protein involved in Fe transport